MSYKLGTYPAIEEAVIYAVTMNQGMKGTELCADTELLSYFVERNLQFSNLLDIVNTLVQSGRLIEIEYVLPALTDRVKAIFFPAKTKVRIVELPARSIHD